MRARCKCCGRAKSGRPYGFNGYCSECGGDVSGVTAAVGRFAMSLDNVSSCQSLIEFLYEIIVIICIALWCYYGIM